MRFLTPKGVRNDRSFLGGISYNFHQTSYVFKNIVSLQLIREPID